LAARVGTSLAAATSTWGRQRVGIQLQVEQHFQI
jgi:hypothetical protein